MNATTPISADIVAGKLAAIGNQQHPEIAAQITKNPRLVELLHFLQWKSWQSGGLDGMTRDLMEKFPERIGYKAIWTFGTPYDDNWSPDQCLAVWADLSGPHTTTSFHFPEFAAFHEAYLDKNATLARIRQDKDYNRAEIEKGFERFNFPHFANECESQVDGHLPHYLAEFCLHVSQPFEGVWYFRELIASILEYMDCHAERVRGQLGETEVSKRVFKRLDMGLCTKTTVMVLGDARVGKTKSVSTWCNMRPGRARLVTVPDGGDMWSFYAAHAEALGLEYTENTPERKLKRAVEYTLQHSALSIAYDEIHFLLPARFTRNTAPRRLNWVRCNVIDKKVSVALFGTRQDFRRSMDNFVKTTQYQMEQWVGRILPALVLPSTPSKTDMLATAKANLPAIEDRLRGLIVAHCIKTETGLQHVETIGKVALYLAQKRGCAAPELADVDAALEDLFPAPGGAVAAPVAAPLPIVPSADVAKPARVPRRALAEHTPAAGTNRISSADPANPETASRGVEANALIAI